MARSRRQIGISPVQVNLPERKSIGPAIIKTGATLANIEFEKAADKRTQEARLAAAQLNFERDGEGNLVAPSLPIGSNGLVGPSIYDREYTNMVSQRYMQQTQIDTSERLNTIATKHALDPSGFREVAEDYVSKVVELAPDFLKGDVSNSAQVQMVEHFNHITRQKAEWDFNESRDVHVNSLSKMYDDLHGYVVAGASDDVIGAQVMKITAAIGQGTALSYWNEGGAELQRQSMDQQIAVASIIGDVTKLAADPVSHAQAIEQLTQFALGEGEVRIVDEFGQVSMVPVTEVFPNTEDRDAIAAVGVGIIKGKEGSRSNLESATNLRQSDQFDEWYLSHAMKQGMIGAPPDMAQLEAWAAKADAANNEPLERRILSIMQGVWGQGAGQGTAVERRMVMAMADAQATHANVESAYLDSVGLESTSELSDFQQEQLQQAKWRASGPIDIPQSQGAAEVIGGMYDSMAGYPVNFRDVSDENLLRIQNWIDKGPANVGVISWDMSIQLKSMLNSNNNDQINQALDIGRMMYDHPALRHNMANATALGRTGEALAYLYENYGPGDIQAGLVEDTLKKFGQAGWSPHQSWSAKSPDDRDEIRVMVDEELEGKFTSVLPGPNEVSVFSGFLRPDIGSYPADMQEQVFNGVRARGGLMDVDNPKTVKRHINAAINETVAEKGWVASKFGWSESRFTDKRVAVHAWTLHGPEAFYKDPDGNVDANVMQQIEVDFQTHLNRLMKESDYKGPKLVAGQNAFLEYNAENTVIVPGEQTHPAYNVRILNVDDQGMVAPSDRWTGGDHYIIDFQLAWHTGNKRTMAEHRARQQLRARHRQQQQGIVINPGTAQ